MQGQQLGESLAHLTAGDDLVHKAVLLQILGALEALRQLLADGLLDNPGTGKADECPRLSQSDIAQRGKAGSDAAGGGVGEH